MPYSLTNFFLGTTINVITEDGFRLSALTRFFLDTRTLHLGTFLEKRKQNPLRESFATEHWKS